MCKGFYKLARLCTPDTSCFVQVNFSLYCTATSLLGTITKMCLRKITLYLLAFDNFKEDTFDDLLEKLLPKCHKLNYKQANSICSDY